MGVFVLLMNNIFLRIKLFSRKFIDKYLYPIRREDNNDKHNDRIYANYGYDYNYDDDDEDDQDEDSNSIENVSLISA